MIEDKYLLIYLLWGASLAFNFLHQSFISYINYKNHKLKEGAYHVGLCLASGLYATCTISPFLDSYSLAYPLFGACVYQFATFCYVQVMASYLNIESRFIFWVKRLALGQGALLFIFFLQYLIFARSDFFVIDIIETNNILYSYAGNLVLRQKPMAILSTLVTGCAIFGVSILFFRHILSSHRKEPFLMLGILLTLILALNDLAFITFHAKYLVPLVAFSYFLETTRFTYIFHQKAFRKVDRLESELIEMEKVAEVGFLVGNITHDIRNPLANIIGQVSLVKKKLQKLSLDDPHISNRLDKVIQAGERIERITHTYLDFFRKDDPENMKPLELLKLLQIAQEVCAEKISHTNLDFIKIEAEAGLTLHGYETQLIMMFSNLFSNACDAIAKLDSRWIEIKAKSEGKRLQIRFIDSGLGIPPEIGAKIFVRQFTTKVKGEGTGLGLDFVKRVAHKHAGEIELDVNHKNTCFLLSFPLARLVDNRSANELAALSA